MIVTDEPLVARILTIPWHTWKHQPVAGDLVIVCSTHRLINIPFDWILATPYVAYESNHNPKSMNPQFTSYADENEWYMCAYIAYPIVIGEQPCLKESYILTR